MNVVFVAPPPEEGGIGKYAEGLRREFRDDVQLSRLDLTEGMSLSERTRLVWRAGTADTDVVHVQFEYAFFNPKLLFAWLFFPLVFALTRFSGTRVVVTMHEVWEPGAVGGEGLKWTYVSLTHSVIAAATDHLVFLSENAEEAFDASVSVDEAVLPHGVNTEAARSIEESAAKEQFGFSPDESVISQIGYVSPRKGTELFLALAEQYPERKFLVAGGPRREQDREYFEDIVERAPSNVTVTGVLSDRKFHAAFVATDVAVLSYTDIRQSGILNWCFAYRVPALCRRIPYFERLASEWGGIVLFDDREEAVERLQTALEKQEQLASEMDDYREAHSFERIAERHVALYRELV